MPRFVWGLALALMVLCGAWGAAHWFSDSGHGRKLILTGSSTLAPLIAEVGKRYEGLHAELRIDVQTGGSSRGIIDAMRGTADIGMSSRALTDDESKELVAHIIAWDGVCFLVHKSNPVRSLSDAQLLSIYLGEIDDWSAVGGRDQPIVVINRAAGRSELSLICEHFGIEAAAIDADVIAGENQQGIKAVAGDPNAIVYMSIGASLSEAERGVPIRALPLGGVEATVDNVAAGRYPLARPLILITRHDQSDAVDAFIEYARSAAVHDLVESLAYVPLRQ